MKQRTRTQRPRILAGLITAGLLATSVVALSAGPASAADVGSIGSAVADDGAKVVSETVVDARTVDLTISSPAVGTAMVRLLLPKDWAAFPGMRWPTLWMYSSVDKEGYKAWTAYTDVEGLTKNDNVLVVLPTAGPTASYTNETRLLGQGPAWETFHTVELMQIIQRGYRSNGANAVAGMSAGGYGALTYSFRHPGLFRMVASYSGLTDLFDPSAKLGQLSTRIQNGASISPWSPLLNISATAAHNPQSNLSKFKGQALYISSGKGQPGPLDTTDPTYKDVVGGRIIEAAAGGMNERFVAGLKRVGVNPTVHIYPDGLHYWTYWNRELALSYPALKASIGAPTIGMATAGAVPGTAAPATPARKGLLSGLFGGLFG